MCIAIPIIDDVVVEMEETFIVQIDVSDEDVSLTVGKATVYINDNDGMKVHAVVITIILVDHSVPFSDVCCVWSNHFHLF